MIQLKDKVLSLTEEFFPEVVNIRRHLHQYPELSFQEFNTSEFIKEKLNEWKISYTEGYVKTGIVATLAGINGQSKTVAVRADMDALPVQEINNLVFKSCNTGIMHACGHDVHMASLLGTARILKELENEINGKVVFIFQPAEEKIPGGAMAMLEQGALDKINPDIILGQHVMPELETGKVGFKSGIYMASADEIYLTIKGKGGHAAMPHQLTDQVLIASHIIVALQQIVSRNALASIPSVLSFGKVEAMGAANIIPSEVKVAGTFRTTNENWRYEAHQKISDMCRLIAESMGAVCEVEIRKGYPSLVNNNIVTTQASQFAKELLGDGRVKELDMQMVSEDFAYFAQRYPATFYRLGISNPENTMPAPLHSPHFLVDEKALKTGMSTMAWLCLSYLGYKSI